jgi:hypothetical protein
MNILKNWNIEAATGYAPITTFYMDFSIADRFGISAIKDTYKRGLDTANFLGYKELTEFVMVLNWKIWEHYESNPRFAELYNSLWMAAEDFARENLKGEELMYYYRTTD